MRLWTGGNGIVSGTSEHPTADEPRDPDGFLPSRAHALALAIFFCFLSFLSPREAAAQLPAARLASVFPAGASAGSATTVSVSGSDLDDLTGLVFSRPGISATLQPGDSHSFRVTSSTNAEPGFCEVRAVGRFGVSNPRVFTLSNLPEVLSPSTNSSPADAFELALDTVCNGRVQATQPQWFRFHAESGQRVIARVQSRELDSRLVPDLAVSSLDGRELAIARRSSLLDFTAPATGTYFLRINDQTYRGGEDYFYRLTLDSGPVAEFAVPQVLRMGISNRVSVFGRNLPRSQPSGISGADGRELQRLEVDLPPSTGGVATLQIPASVPLARRPSSFGLRESLMSLSIPIGAKGPLPMVFGLTTHPVFTTLVEPVTSPASASPLVPVTPPCEFGALFPGRGQLSGVTFTAKKGEILWLEIWSDRLGHNSDPRLIVQRIDRDPQGKERHEDILELNDLDSNPVGRDFDTTSRDAAGRFQAPLDGQYRVLVRDLFQGSVAGRRIPYRLSIRPETPDFRLAALPQPQPRLNDNDRQVHLWNTVLRQGETQPLRVIASRQDGFDGEIEITATNLPPGVTLAPALLLSGQTATSLLLTTAADAPSGSAPVSIIGRARIGGADVVRRAAAGTVVWHVPDWDQERATARPSEDLWVSVCGVESAPVTVAPTSPAPLEVSAGGNLTIPLSIRRSELFPAAFNLRVQGHPEALKWKDISVAEKATNAVITIAAADNKLPPGTHTLWLQALVPGRYRNNPEALAAAEEELKVATAKAAAAPPEGKAPAEEARKSAEARKKSAEERAKPRDLTTAAYSRPLIVKILPAAGGTGK